MVENTLPSVQKQQDPAPSSTPVNTFERDLEQVHTEKSRHHSDEHDVRRVVTALDWTDDDDPENPENWGGWKKAFHVAYVGLQCFVV